MKNIWIALVLLVLGIFGASALDLPLMVGSSQSAAAETIISTIDYNTITIKIISL